jgi:PAS domain S-box-containing protein
MRLPSPEQMGRFMENAAIAMMICDADRVHYANQAFAALLSYGSPDDLEQLHPIDDFVSPEHRDACRTSLLRVLQSDVAMEQQWFHARRRDGSDIWLHARFHPMSSPEGPCAFLTIVDDTEEREERHRLNMLRRAVEVVSEAILVTDMPGTILYANEAAGKLFGVEVGELLGTSALGMISPEAAADQVTYFRTRENLMRSGELLLRKASGQDFPAAITVNLFRDAEGTATLAMAIVRDLTVQKQMEAERAHREDQLAVMLREAHHRIKNSLQIACDVLELQRRSAESGEAMQALNDAVTRIRALSAVHEWISPDHDVSAVGVRQLIQTIAENLGDTLTDPHQPVRFDLQTEEHRIGSREATALALVTTELITNALRHATPTVVRVRFVVGAEEAVLEVTNDGADHDGFVDGFPTDGFGLGLVKLLAEEQLEGGLSVESARGMTTARVLCPACATRRRPVD